MGDNHAHRRTNGAAYFAVLLGFALICALLLGGATVDVQARVVGAGPSAQATAATPRILVLQVYFRSLAERDRLTHELDTVEMPTSGGYLTVVSDQAGLDSLRRQGLRVEIDQAFTAGMNTPVKFGNDPATFYGGYHTVEEMQTFMDQKVAAYPNLVEKVDIGDSWCKTHPGQCTQPNSWGGFDLYALHITNRSISGPKPVFWYNTGIHAREIAPPEVAMFFVNYLLDGYDSNADAHWLVDYDDIWVMLPNNPDGHHIVESGGGQPVSWRKNNDHDDGCNTYGSWGTDLNRNFPFMWACCGGSSGNPCAIDYRGPAPNSEEETQAIVAKTHELIPDQRGPNINDPAPITTTGAFLDMHSVASLDLYPWGMTYDLAPNDADLHNLAGHIGSANADPPGNPYTVEQSVGLYPTDGASDDNAYGELGVPAFTIEVGGGSFFPSYSYTQNTIWPENRGALVYLSKVARQPYLITRGPDSKLVATTPMTVTQGTPSQLTGTINYDWSYAGTNNHYRQNVRAAEYYLDTPPWAGGTPVAMQAVDGQFDSPTEAVQATVQTGSIAPGRHVLYVRGRGVNDYEGFQSWGPVSAAWLWVLPVEGTPTPTPPVTPTPTPPTPSVTSTPTCNDFSGGGITACFDWGYDYSFAINNGCAYAVTAVVSIDLEAAPTMQGPWDVISSQGGNITFQPGENYVNNHFYSGIPSQYIYYRIHFRAPSLNLDLIAGPATICQVRITPTITPGITPTSTPCPIVRITPTITPGITPTSTPCPIQFTDVPPENTFYPYVRCLACRGVLSGYSDNTFRPNNNITRGQIAKVVSNAANFQDDVTGRWTYTDVPDTNTFWLWIERLTIHGVMSGYNCGGAGEPCDPQNRPYFRWANNATRAQLAKIDSNAAGYSDDPTTQTFADVDANHPFYVWIERLATRGIMSGYQCGGAGEPCDPQNRPYFRPYNNVTRGQAAKIVANTFYPNCQSPRR